MIQVKTMYRDTDEDTVSPGDMLANAIIMQAVRDFRHARKRLRRSPDDREANTTIREIVRFFSSRYFCLLARLDGPELLQRIIREDKNGGGDAQ